MTLRGAILAAIVACSLVVAVPAIGQVCIACGTERWEVRTLSDPAAHDVNFHPVSRSIETLRRLHPPVST